MRSFLSRSGRGRCSILTGASVLGVGLFAGVALELLPFALDARQSRTVADGVYTGEQAARGQAIYMEQCAACHGDALEGGLGPPLAGDGFLPFWHGQTLASLVDKIQLTMPFEAAGTLSRQESTDLAAYMLQAGGFDAGEVELAGEDAALAQIAFPAAPASPQRAAADAPSFPPAGNMNQLMKSILFPNSNIIFNTQTHDPGEDTVRRWMPGNGPFNYIEWGASEYRGWELVDAAAVALAESAPLLLVPGRRCENGRPVPVDRDDWVQFSEDLAEAGRAAYRASQSRDLQAMIEVTEVLNQACANCHTVYRDKPGGTPEDPSNRAARCLP